MVNVNLDSSLSMLWIVLLLIIANGVFAMTEIAIVTSRKSRLEKMAEEGNAKAAIALKLAEHPNQLLSTIQIGITLIGIVTGAFSGAAIAGQLAKFIDRISYLQPYSKEISMFIVVALTTYLSLIIGELVPKRIGLTNPEKVALMVAKPMYYFAKIGRPLIWILSKSTEFVLKLIGVKQSNEPEITEEEIQQMIEKGVYSGVVDEIESEIVEQIFYTGDSRIGDILTPRTQLVWIDIEKPFEENLKKMISSSHSKFPVGRGSLDEFLGVIYIKDIFAKMAEKKPFKLEDCIQETLVLPEPMKVFQALEILKKSGRHEAIVIDEYGGIEGFITLHDFMESIVGEIPYYEDDSEPQIVERDEKSWLADGLVSLDTFKRYFDIEDLPEVRGGTPHTLGGYITMYIGDIPKLNQSIEIEGYRLEVVDMDHVRVDKVLITRIGPEEGKGDE